MLEGSSWGREEEEGLRNAYVFLIYKNDVCGVSCPLRKDKSRMVRSGSQYHAGVVCPATRNPALQDSVELIDVPEGGEKVCRRAPPRFGLGVLQEGTCSLGPARAPLPTTTWTHYSAYQVD